MANGPISGFPALTSPDPLLTFIGVTDTTVGPPYVSKYMTLTAATPVIYSQILSTLNALFVSKFSSPTAIGNTAPSSGAFTSLSATGTSTLTGLVGIGASPIGQTPLNIATSAGTPGLIYGLVDQATLIPNTNGQSLAGALIQNTVNLNTHTSLEYDGVYISTPTLTGSGSLSFGFMLTVQAPAAGMQGYAEFGSVGSITSTGLNGMAIGTTTPNTGVFTLGTINNTTYNALLLNRTSGTNSIQFQTAGTTIGFIDAGAGNGINLYNAGGASIADFQGTTLTLPNTNSFSVGGTSTLTGNVTVGNIGTVATPVLALNGTGLSTINFVSANVSNVTHQIGSYFNTGGGFASLDISSGQFTVHTVGALALTLDPTQNATFAGKVLSTNATGGIGYTTGAGGTVVQATNKATSVTLNKLTGAITTSNAALAGNTVVSFQVVLSAMGSNDTIITTLKSGAATPGTYEIWASETGGGAFNMNIRNITAGPLSEALVINYVVLKGSNA